MIRTVFFLRKKRRAKKDFQGAKLFFEAKIYDFCFKNNFAPIDFLLARLSSVAMSAFRTIKSKA